MPEMFMKPKLALRNGALTTTENTYKTIEDEESEAEYFRCKGYANKVMMLRCTLNDLLYQIDVAPDDGAGEPESWRTKKTDVAISSGDTVSESLTEPWSFIRVKIKPAVGGDHGKLQFDGEFSTL